MTQRVSILLPLLCGGPFTYALPKDAAVERGQLVEVPFRTGLRVGVIWDVNPTDPYKGALKEISRSLDLPPLPIVTLDFIEWVSRYTLTPIGMVLKMVLPSDLKDTVKSRTKLDIPKPNTETSSRTLAEDQTEASDTIRTAIRAKSFQPFVLDGVTGSGKTEVYLEAMITAFERGQQVLVLLPEIALTNQWLDRFQRRFGCLPLQWHSGLSLAVKRQTWRAVLSGEAPVIVGARSALFLPFRNLGLIVVDEEHDGSYKQEEQVLYHARDMAVVRAHLSGIPIVLTSATPSLETYANVTSGKYKLISLPTRHGGATMPDISVVDMRTHKGSWISPPLQKAIQETLGRGEQVMLFLNRRGYAPLTLCRDCGHRIRCPSCAAWLVEHKRSHQLHCHHCDFRQKIPTHCPDCKAEDSLIPCGPGVERIQEAVTELFPTARTSLLTSDTFSTPEQIREGLQRIADHEVDIIIGTQILAKGHHFPKITLVGVVDADLGLSGGDLRGCERTYQLLHQVSGRAGREHLPGSVMLQTYNPTHPVMLALQSQDRDQFLEIEAAERLTNEMPPYGRLAAIIVSGLDSHAVERTANALAKSRPNYADMMILGPVPAPLAQLRGRHRWRFLVKTSKNAPLQQIIAGWIKQTPAIGNSRITVDIDPYNFL